MSSQDEREALVHALLARPVLRTGAVTGGLLVLVMAVSLFLANGVPALERIAWLRNDLSRLAFAMVMLMPICRFLNTPRRLFSSALLGWVIFTIGYSIAGVVFSNLFTSIGRTPLEALLLGAVVYGVVAVLDWIVLMILAASHHPAARAGTEAHHVPHHR